MSEIKNCPFCGDGAIILIRPESGFRYGQCLSCFSSGPAKPDYDSAVSAWNQRVNHETNNIPSK